MVPTMLAKGANIISIIGGPFFHFGPYMLLGRENLREVSWNLPVLSCVFLHVLIWMLTSTQCSVIYDGFAGSSGVLCKLCVAAENFPGFLLLRWRYRP